ncbi:MAG TPA: diaminopimelate decarboxylase [Polyangiaceae bacterium]|jgi:diaminopimelate decarboxylase
MPKKLGLSGKKRGNQKRVHVDERTIATVLDARAETPAYIYDLDAIEAEAGALEAAFGSRAHGVFYAVKANSAGSIVRALASHGVGADVVTGAELLLALACGVSPEKIVYSGVAKTDEEIDVAVTSGDRGIRAIQVESIEEVGRVHARARTAGRVQRIAIRVNPGLDFEELATHAHVATGHDEAKFGIASADLDAALAAIASAKNLSLAGISSHVGSQFFKTAPYVAAARIACDLSRAVRDRFPLEFVDTGGGFGVDYTGAACAKPADFVRETLSVMREARVDDLALHVEPGRVLVAAHGVLLARVIQRKVSPSSGQKWLMIDAGMNDLIRPALYQAKHRVVAIASSSKKTSAWRVVGPCCESADDFGEHALPDEGFDYVALLDAGAYGYTMASRYNGRAFASEVFLRGTELVSVSPRAPLRAWADERART